MAVPQASYSDVLEAALSLYSAGKPQHSRTLLSRAEAQLRMSRDSLQLTESQRKTRAQILSFLPNFCVLCDKPPEVSFAQSAKQYFLSPPEGSKGDCEAVEDWENQRPAAFERVLDLYRNERVVEAIEELSKVEDLRVRSDPAIEEMLRDYEEIQVILSSFQEREGWQLESSKGGITVETKVRPGVPTVSVKSFGRIPIPVLHLSSLIYESDLYSEWVPFCRQSHSLGQLTRVRKVIYQYFRIPLIADREVVIYGFGVNMLRKEGAIMVVARSLQEGEVFKGVQVPLAKQGNVRAQVNFFGALIRPVTRSETEMHIITNFDPRLKAVPYRLLNWFSRKFARKMFTTIANQARKFEGSLHQQRINGGEEFYSYVQQSLEEYFEEKGL